MKSNQSLPDNKKLTINYRMEPGCLGPAGESLIEDYCKYAGKRIASLDEYFTNWVIEPRYDKTVSEIQYRVNGKELSTEMVEKYLAVFGREMDDFELLFNDKLMKYIEEFLSR